MKNPTHYVPIEADAEITWGSFYRQWRPLFFNLACQICGDARTADDIVQESMRRVLDRASQGDLVFKHVQHAVNYVAMVVRNCAKDWVRRESRTVALDDVPDPPVPSVEEQLLDKEAEELWERYNAATRKNIDKLTNDERRLLKYRLEDKMTLQEISEKTGDPVTTIAYRINAILKKLKRMLEGD